MVAFLWTEYRIAFCGTLSFRGGMQHSTICSQCWKINIPANSLVYRMAPKHSKKKKNEKARLLQGNECYLEVWLLPLVFQILSIVWAKLASMKQVGLRPRDSKKNKQT